MQNEQPAKKQQQSRKAVFKKLARPEKTMRLH